MSTSNLMTYLLQSPCYLLGYFAILFFGWLAGRTKNSVWNVVRRAPSLSLDPADSTGHPIDIFGGRCCHDDHYPKRRRSVHRCLSIDHGSILRSEHSSLLGDANRAQS